MLKTFLVFLDLPMHVEYRVHDMPLMPAGVEIHVRATLRNPRNAAQSRKVDDVYSVKRNKTVYSSEGPTAGLAQYLELERVS